MSWKEQVVRKSNPFGSFPKFDLGSPKGNNLSSHPKEMPTSFCSKLLRCSSASSSGLRCEKLRSFKWLNGHQWTIQIIGDTNVTSVKHVLIPRFSDKQPRSALKTMGIL